MGYKPTRKVYDIQFTDYPGLEIKATSTSLGKLMQLSDMQLNLNEPDAEKRLEVFTVFAGCIVSWNMEHPELTEDNKQPDSMCCKDCGLMEGIALPATVQGMMCLELGFMMSLIFGWMAAISRVNVPKELSLSNGGNDIPGEVMRLLGQHPNLSTLPMPS
jgi:hypothetical protein